MSDKFLPVSEDAHYKVKLASIQGRHTMRKVTGQWLALAQVMSQYFPKDFDFTNGQLEEVMSFLQSYTNCSDQNKEDVFRTLVVKVGGQWS